ncbi:MAG TPA: choline-sulfatase, partial [Verrucomicrobiales bacterium]|nr:choline-sulfatase [Verrucomicrobiales bacterium]
RDERLLPWPRTAADVKDELAVYYAVLDHIDHQVGRLLGQLRRDGRLDNTFVIFTSDHGLALGSHGLMGKQNMYDHSIKVPFIFAGPGIARGVRTGAFGYLRDMFPTTCELAGIAIPKTVQSRSLAPVLLGKQKTVHRLGYGYFRDVQRMVRDENWKLIFYPKLKKYQLFDLVNDPNELNNLAEAASQMPRMKRMRQVMARWFHDEGDGVFAK